MLLIIGAIINIAVAWAFCAFSEMGDPSESNTSGDDWLWLTDSTGMATRNNADTIAWNFQTHQMTGTASRLRWIAGTNYPNYSSLFGDRAVNSLGLQFRAGWPMYSFTGVKLDLTKEFILPTLNEMPWYQDSKNIGIIDLPGKFTGRMLPWHPIVFGFIVNTLFYALILWIAIYIPRSMIRERRWRRGLCPDCGYPVGSSPTCTECGALLPSKIT
ncbi:MAG TPA: hypothetical protein VG711_03040 [Phycisphaerales bacterium]|nr:hypothetical protein [Phycisphaerales bacterium]